MPNPSSCLCGSADFIRVTVHHKSGELYRTEFVSCIACGVMYHRPERASSIEPMTSERREYLKKTGWLR
jgi:hypothetical protein